jgi:hypothetical protein
VGLIDIVLAVSITESVATIVVLFVVVEDYTRVVKEVGTVL